MSIEGKKHNVRSGSFSVKWDLTENYNLGDTLSDRYEELFWRGGEEQVYIYIYIWYIFLAGGIWEVHVVKHKAITVIHKEQVSR